MGTIDAAYIKLTCEKCGISEERRYSDKGSMWGGSHWNNIPAFDNFDVESTEGGKQEPHIKSAKCKHCGSVPKIDHRYAPFG